MIYLTSTYLVALFIISTIAHANRLVNKLTLENYLNINNINLINETIYIAGENILLSVSTHDLSITNRLVYGPVLDSYKCKYYPKEDCSWADRQLMNNYNKIIQPINDTHLLTCWTAMQGKCDVRLISDLKQIAYNLTLPIVNNDPLNSTLALITNDMLLVANTYNGNYGQEQVPAIAGRSLHTLQIHTSNSGLKSTKSSLEFMSRFLKSFIVSYVYTFKHANFIYFLTVQPSDVNNALNNNNNNINNNNININENQRITKVARLCANDKSLIRSYTETPLQCGSYTQLVHATQFKSSNSKNDDVFLMGLFENLATRQQAICVYSLKQIDSMINENIRSCLLGNGTTQRGLSFIKPDQRCIRNNNLFLDENTNYCSSAFIENNLFPIGGGFSIKTRSVYELNTYNENVTFNHLNIVNDSSGNMNLVLLSNEQNLLQFYRVTFNRRRIGFNLTKYDEIQLDSVQTRELIITRPRTNLQIDLNLKKLYVIHKNFLYSINLDELEASFDCNKLNCVSCIDQVKCGWCSDKAKCMLKQDLFRQCSLAIDALAVSTCESVNKTHENRCDSHETCKSCSESSDCSWCNNKCEQKSEKCVASAQSCPYFDLFSNKLLIPYLDSKVQTSSIQFYMENHEQNDAYNCLVENLNLTAKYQQLNATHSSCALILHADNNHLITMLKQNNGLFETRLKLVNKRENYLVTSLNPKSKLIFYKCDLMIQDSASCQSCKSLDSQYSCAYCDSKCKFTLDKSCDTKCVKPQQTIEVLSVRPMKIPLSSGSLVEIDLQSSFLSESKIRSVRICDQECDLKRFIKYADAKKQKIQCSAQAYTKKSTCKIEIHMENDELVVIDHQIEYVDPSISDLRPNQIIQSSKGVQLNLIGNDLDAGSIQQIQIVDQNELQFISCIIQSLSSTQIKCEINDTFESIGKKNLKLIYESTQSALNYMQAINVNSNPILGKLSKHETLVSGGTKFQLSGYNFDSAQDIYTFVTVGDVFQSDLVPMLKRVSNDKLIFRFPNIDLISDSYIKAKIGFKLDGLTKILDDALITYEQNPFKHQQDEFKIDYVDKLDLQTDVESQILIIYFKNQIKNEKYKEDFELYIRISDSMYCECEQQYWFNGSYLTCRLSTLDQCSRLVNQSQQQVLQQTVRSFIGFWEIKQSPVFSLTLKSLLDNASTQSTHSKSTSFYSNLSIANQIIIICVIISFILLLVIILAYYIHKYYKFKSKFCKEKFTDTTHRLSSFTSNDYQLRKIESTTINRYELDLKLKLEYLNELNYDLIYQGVPLWPYKNYLLNFLFGNPVKSNLTNQQQTPSSSVTSSSTTSTTTRTSLFYATIKSQFKPNHGVNEAMSLFNQLLHNKIFLNIFIQTCDSNENNSFNMNDRVQFSSILCLLLKDNLSYLYTIIKCQLSEYIGGLQDLKSNKARLLFRQSNTIIEFLVSKFLTMFMYQFVKENCSVELYRLVKIIKHQIESAPVDFLANKSYNCINENYILKVPHLIYTELNVNFINSCDLSRVYKAKILDCDTIFQAKEKLLDCLYKNSSYSLRPSVNDIDIEFRISNSSDAQAEKLLIYNYSSIILKEYDANRKLLQIKDYCLFDEAYVYLIFKTNHFYEGASYTLPPSIPPCGTENHYYLTQQQQQQHQNNTLSIGETYLSRLVRTKCQLEPYLNSLLESIFKNASNLPPIIKHLFDFIDHELESQFPSQQSATDLMELGRLWKTNSYFLRFWINLLKNPQYLFDINKTPLIDASLTSIAQVFMDSCSMNDQLLDKDSSTNKLLFSNDVKQFKCLVDSFYNEIKTSQSISDHELHFYFSEYSKAQPQDMNQIQLLLDLYDYYEKYEKKINETLGKQQASILLPLHHKLVQIKDLLSTSNQSDLNANCV